MHLFCFDRAVSRRSINCSITEKRFEVGHLRCLFYGDLYPNKEWYNPRVGEVLRKLVQARKIYAHGVTIDYFKYRNCIGFVRTGMGRRPGCAVVLRSGKGVEDEESLAKEAQGSGESTQPSLAKAKTVKDDDLGSEIRMRVPLHNRLVCGFASLGRLYALN